ncbi:uncharacterized protein LOC121429222 [Lytechinus variegatus]|uniref:uncharacterized protein LOC121429222 n=1 Tax=Lytechinus variegatus TaxID=7654 RepID=UPI001BB18618|nr:uncharacterized protein LOC121429222 [Lytechinus variegatus]
MKVSVIIACLAIVPFIVAQAAPVAEEEEAYDPIAYIANVIKEKTQQALDLVQEGHAKVNDLFTSLEIPAIPGQDQYPSVEQIKAQLDGLTENIDTLAENIKERVQTAIDGLNFDQFDLDGEPEPGSEPEPNSEPEPEQPTWSWPW